MKKEEIQEKAKGLLKNKKSMEIIIAVIIIAIIAVIFISTLAPPKTEETISGTQSVEQLETKLEGILSEIAGAGNVRVMITYETDKEMVPAMDTQKQYTTNENLEGGAVSQSETESSRPVTIQQQSGADPVVITEIQPVVRGAVIVAEGAGDPKVKMDLLLAAQTVLNISPSQVDVFTMDQNDYK